MKDGVYLRLFHGRADNDEELDGWGRDGPVIGPFDGFHVTYWDTMRFICGGEIAMMVVQDEGLFHFQGVWYGDWVICDARGAGEYLGRTHDGGTVVPLIDPSELSDEEIGDL